MVLACRKILLPVVLFLRKNIKISHSDNNPTLPMATTMSAYQIHYTFTGKEKDTETGYYYFGARYYDSDYSIWLSVDPMADKYPSMSPYNYCACNPMKLVDPDGDSIILSKEAWGIMCRAIKSTLYVSGDDSPFYYENGYMLYDSEKTYTSNNADQQEIFSHLKELATATEFNVFVSVVNNDERFPTLSKNDKEFVNRSMKELGAYGYAQYNSLDNTCKTYVSSKPLRFDRVPYPQTEDYQSISILHEVGGHAYYYMNGAVGDNNCRLTEQFEQRCRNIFKGNYGSKDIRYGTVKIHSP